MLKNNKSKRAVSFFKKNLLKKSNAQNKGDNVEKEQAGSEIKLQKLEEFFQQGRKEYLNLFRSCPVPLAYTDIDGILLLANRCFEELSGFSEEEVKGNSLIYCLRPEEPALFDPNSSKNSFEANIYNKEGYPVQAIVNKRFNRVENRLAGIIFSFQNISFLRRERRLKHVLYKISQLCHSDLTLSELYPQIQGNLKKVLIAANFYIALWDSKKEELFFPYYTDEAAGDDEIFIQRYCSSQSIFHYILKNGKPVLMDFQRYRKMISYGYIESWDVMTNTHLWLAVPLKVEEKVIGVLALQSYDNARLYSEKDIDLLEFVAEQLSTAIFRKTFAKDTEREAERKKDILKSKTITEYSKTYLPMTAKKD